jgi:hypothetical protein
MNSISCRNRNLDSGEEIFDENHCSKMNLLSRINENAVGSFCRAAHALYIFEHHRMNMHTVADADLHDAS